MQDNSTTEVAEEVTGAAEEVPARLRPKTDLFVGIGLVIFGAIAAFESWRMPRFGHLGAELYEAPGLVPGLLGLIIAVFGLLILVRALSEGAIRGFKTGAKLLDMLRSIETRRLVLLIVITLGYAWGLVGRMPFGLATFFFMMAFILLFDWRDAAARAARRRLLVTATIQAVITAFAVVHVFQEVFRVRLP